MIPRPRVYLSRIPHAARSVQPSRAHAARCYGEAGVSRENLYRSLSGQTKPEFDTILRVLAAPGGQLTAKAKIARGGPRWAITRLAQFRS
jgi:DNA-binding phage protein